MSLASDPFVTKLERLGRLVQLFDEAKLRKTDPQGNPVKVLPGLGSLRSTPAGFELSLRATTGRGTREGVWAWFDAAAGQVFMEEARSIPSRSLSRRETCTLDLERKSIRGFQREDLPETLDFSVYGLDLS